MASDKQEFANRLYQFLLSLIENDEVMDFLDETQVPDLEVRDIRIEVGDVTYGDLLKAVLTDFNDIYIRGEED